MTLSLSYRLASAVACFLVVITAILGVWLVGPVRPGSTTTIEFSVAAGQGTSAIAYRLQDAHLIRNRFAFMVYTRLVGIQSDLKAGTYLISPSMSTPAIADLIASGRGISDDIIVTIPEGSNVWEIDTVVASVSAPIRPNQFSYAASGKEGHLFPETYRFAKDAAPIDVISRMTSEFAARAGQFTASQVIVASMLEKEAKAPDDMALVAGIIARRMEIGMPLQIDATVGYGWCMRTAGYARHCDVTQAPIAMEIKIDGPYNTYTRRGLPVGPISNPGLNSLTAAKNPKTSDYLYYLSTRDGSQLIYSKTLSEHLKNRKKYLGF